MADPTKDIYDLNVDVSLVAQAIEQISTTLNDYADELKYLASQMREKNDLEYGSEALNAVKNCFGNLRLDLIQTRTMRAINWAMKEHAKELVTKKTGTPLKPTDSTDLPS